MLRTIKNLIPPSARFYLKKRLPGRLVGLVAQTPQSPQKLTVAAEDTILSGKPIRQHAECPICGTAIISADGKAERIQCTGCGAFAEHRRLALAVYAHVKQAKDLRVLALGSDSVLKPLFDGMDNVCFAENLTQVPNDLKSRINLCVHTHWIQESNLDPAKALKSVDALLAPHGVQIFTADMAALEKRMTRWPLKSQPLVENLRENGWPEISHFEPENFYGTGAGRIFGCRPTQAAPGAAIVLPKTSARIRS